MKRLAQLFLLLGVLSGSIEAVRADVKTGGATLRAVGTGRAGHITLEVCEMGECINIVRKGGFSASQWTAIAQECKTSATYNGTMKNVFTTLASAAAVYAGVYLKFPMLIIFGTVGPSAIGQVDQKEIQAMMMASQMMKGTIDPAQNFDISVRDFVSLEDGLIKCVNDYTNKVRAMQFRDRCKNIFNPSECYVPQEDLNSDGDIHDVLI